MSVITVNLFKKLETVEPGLRGVLLAILEEIEKQQKERVTKDEFRELREIVAELAQAQKKTEDRVNELAEAQKKTEERLDSLVQKVNELAEAQKRTEQRLNELAEAQKKTEQRLNELAEAQKKTEEELKKLVSEHRKTREQLGGLSHTVGYVLEDRAYIALPQVLNKDLGLEVIEIKRDFIELSPNKYEELNIIGKGKKNGSMVWILGECKTQLKKKDVDSFLKKLSRVEHLFPGEKVLIMVTYQTSPQVKRYVQEKGIRLYFSYQLQNAIWDLL